MSTAYGYHCRTCEQTSLLENKMLKEVGLLLHKRREIAHIFQCFRSFDLLPIDMKLECNFQYADEYTEDGRGILEWLGDHAEHDVVVYDEYGYTYKATETYERIE